MRDKNKRILHWILILILTIIVIYLLYKRKNQSLQMPALNASNISSPNYNDQPYVPGALPAGLVIPGLGSQRPYNAWVQPNDGYSTGAEPSTSSCDCNNKTSTLFGSVQDQIKYYLNKIGAS